LHLRIESKFIHIGFESYKGLPGNTDHQHSNIIAYITARGAEDSKKLWEPLNKTSHLVAKIQALVAQAILQVGQLSQVPVH
jgi:hypothetical protein